jgi:hypothetical protein
MTSDNYSRTITVNNIPAFVYDALTTCIGNWWIKFDSPISKLADQAKYYFQPIKYFWTFKAIILKPNERIEIRCVEALHKLTRQPKEIEKEWLGIKVIWQILPNGGSTDMQIEHVGLTPSLHC